MADFFYRSQLSYKFCAQSKKFVKILNYITLYFSWYLSKKLNFLKQAGMLVKILQTHRSHILYTLELAKKFKAI